MKSRGSLNKSDLLRAALHKSLQETMPLIPLFFAGLFVWEAVVMHGRNTGRLFLSSACFAAALWLFLAAIICCSPIDGISRKKLSDSPLKRKA